MYYIIYQTAFIGDIILSTSLAKTIKQVDPNCKIIFVTTPVGAAILQNNEKIDQIIVYDKKGKDRGFRGLLKKVKEIRSVIQNDESVFLSPHRFLRASIIGFLSRSKIRAGFKTSTISKLYNRLTPYRKRIHEIQRNYELLNSVFKERLSDTEPELPELFPSEDDYLKIKKYVLKHFNTLDNIITIAPGSAWATKRWPGNYFKELTILLKKYGFNIILLGGKDDKDLCDNIVTNDVLNLAGEFSLLESSAAISISKAIVSNDSAPVHMASAMNIPTIAIFGATTSNLGFGPLADMSLVVENNNLACRPCGVHGSRACKKKHFSCMKDILPDLVFKEVIKVIKKK